MSHSDVDWAAEKIDDFVADAAPKLSCPSPFLRLNLEMLLVVIHEIRDVPFPSQPCVLCGCFSFDGVL